jgi:hypothetical protein
VFCEDAAKTAVFCEDAAKTSTFMFTSMVQVQLFQVLKGKMWGEHTCNYHVLSCALYLIFCILLFILFRVYYFEVQASTSIHFLSSLVAVSNKASCLTVHYCYVTRIRFINC